MISTLFIKALLLSVSAAGGGYWLVKRGVKKDVNKQVKLEQKKSVLEERVEDDLTDIKRDLLIKRLQNYSLDESFSQRLSQVHEIFEQKNYKHARAHTFYTLLLPKLLAVKEAREELSNMTNNDIDTEEMYASLNAWMDDIIAHKIDGLEGQAEINAKVITLLTK